MINCSLVYLDYDIVENKATIIEIIKDTYFLLNLKF